MSTGSHPESTEATVRRSPQRATMPSWPSMKRRFSDTQQVGHRHHDAFRSQHRVDLRLEPRPQRDQLRAVAKPARERSTMNALRTGGPTSLRPRTPIRDR